MNSTGPEGGAEDGGEAGVNKRRRVTFTSAFVDEATMRKMKEAAAKAAEEMIASAPVGEEPAPAVISDAMKAEFRRVADRKGEEQMAKFIALCVKFPFDPKNQPNFLEVKLLDWLFTVLRLACPELYDISLG
jgi:hypothetical protein